MGSSIQQLNLQTYGIVNATAVDLAKGLSKTRRFQPPPVTAGYEFVAVMNLVENAQRVREEVVEHLKAPPVTAGKKDLVLLPSHLWLTIHESLGHSTELDRALGYEANYAGTSFLTTDKLGKERVGSDIDQRLGRPHQRAGPRHRRLRRRRRQGHALPDHRKGHLQALSDHPRPGRPDRRKGVARLLLRR